MDGCRDAEEESLFYPLALRIDAVWISSASTANLRVSAFKFFSPPTLASWRLGVQSILSVMPVHDPAVPAVEDPAVVGAVPVDVAVAEEHVHADRAAVLVDAVIVLDHVIDAVAGRQLVGGEDALGGEAAV